MNLCSATPPGRPCPGTRWSSRWLAYAPSPVSGIGVFGVMVSLFVAFPNVHATRFDASLPIVGRDLVLARASPSWP